MIAVDGQTALLPISLTTSATHDGPQLLGVAGWSDHLKSGITQATAGNRAFLTSTKTFVSGEMTLRVQSGPSYTSLIALKADQTPPTGLPYGGA
jgi:hypothetical protein